MRMHCDRLINLLCLQVCSHPEQQCDKQVWTKAVDHTSCETDADQGGSRMQGGEGSGRASQVATATGPLGSEIDTGKQSSPVSQRCTIADAQARGSSDQQKGQTPSWLSTATGQEQQVMERKQQMNTPVKTPHARSIHTAHHFHFPLPMLQKSSECETSAVAAGLPCKWVSS